MPATTHPLAMPCPPGNHAPRRRISARVAVTALLWALAQVLPVSSAASGPWPGSPGGARLLLDLRGDELLAWADNRLEGPVEVMLHDDSHRAAARPALPARATVPPRGRTLVARIAAADAAGLPLRLVTIPGHPGARPREVDYGWPLETTRLRVTQGWGGRSSHDTVANRHAVDLAAPVGTAVLAAREGVVMQTEAGFGEGAFDPAYRERANFVRILHTDGSMALYAHLDAGSLSVRAGEHVRRGQRLGRSGNTGLSSGPHLHFVVQVNRGMRLESIPFRMVAPGGLLQLAAPAP